MGKKAFLNTRYYVALQDIRPLGRPSLRWEVQVLKDLEWVELDAN